MNETDLKEGMLPNDKPFVKPTIIVLGTSKAPKMANVDGILKRLAVVRSVCFTGIAAIWLASAYKDYRKHHPSKCSSKWDELLKKSKQYFEKKKEDLSKGE